jgi:hypothetical protein
MIGERVGDFIKTTHTTVAAGADGRPAAGRLQT